MKHLKIFENWISEAIGVLSKEDLDKSLETFIKANPKAVATNEILPCGAIIKTNDYTGIKTTETGFIELYSPKDVPELSLLDSWGSGSGTFQITKESNGKISIYISLNSSTAYSIPSGEIFYIKFVDGSVMKIPTSGSRYDDSHSVFISPVTVDKLNILKKKKINGMKYYIQETEVSEESASVFINALNCVIAGKVPSEPVVPVSP